MTAQLYADSGEFRALVWRLVKERGIEEELKSEVASRYPGLVPALREMNKDKAA